MSDTLSTISTEKLTADVASLLQRPLPDSDHILHASTPSQTPGACLKARQIKMVKLTELTTRSSQTISNISPHFKESLPSSNELTQKILPLLQTESYRASVSIGQKHAANSDTPDIHLIKSGKSQRKSASKVSANSRKRKHSKVKVPKQKSKDTKSSISLQKYGQNKGSELRTVTADSSKDEMSRKLLELSKLALSSQTETPRTISDICERQSSIWQENGSIQASSEPQATGKSNVVPSSSNFAACMSARDGAIPVMISPVPLSFGCHPSLPSVVHPSDSKSVSATESVVVSTVQSSNYFSTPWVPHQLTDGMVPMLTLGPGLNIPLSVRPANTQLVTALLSRFPAILPKPSLAKPTLQTIQNQPVVSVAPAAMVTTATSQPPAQTTSSPTPSQYLNETMNPPSATNMTMGDPTGMELQSLMNIVYGFLTDKDHPGRTPTPGSLQLDSSFPHISSPNQSIAHPLQNSNLSEASLTVMSPPSVSQSGPGSVEAISDHYSDSATLEAQQGEKNHQAAVEINPRGSVHYQQISNNTTISIHQSSAGSHPSFTNLQPVPFTHAYFRAVQPAAQSAIQPISQPYHNHVHHHSGVLGSNHPSVISQPSAPVISQPSLPVISHPSESVISQPSAHIISQPSIPVISQPSVPVISHQPVISHPSVISHTEKLTHFTHDVISHTDRLMHPVQVGSYHYQQQPAMSNCMYMHQPVRQTDKQNNTQRLYHYNASGDSSDAVDRYKTPNYAENQAYAAVSAADRVEEYTDQEFTATQDYSKVQEEEFAQEHVVASEQINTQEHMNNRESTCSQEHMTIEEREIQDTSQEIFCVDCNKTWNGPCQAHNREYTHIEDSPLPTRARASLPSCFYLKQTGTSTYQSLGVWCKETVNCRTQFGPVVGPGEFEQREHVARKDVHFNPFQIVHKDNETEILSMTDENSCNWIMFVQLAESMLQQNCVLYQQGRKLFIITKKEVEKDTELLMWFSGDICMHLKISADPAVCKLVQCTACGQSFVTKKQLRSHTRLKHPTEAKESWTCFVCSKSYSSQTKLNSHMMIHMGLKPHRCLYCNKEFTDYSNLKVHQYIHTGQKKYTCATCNRTFRQKAHLNSHMITHTGEKNIQCKYCDKRFARQSDCKLHEYQHTKERVYTCEVCKKVFYKTQTFKRHQKVHTGERNYMCNKCFKGFHTKYHRDRHLKICKEKGGKESTYMSLEEVANLDNTCDVVPLTVKAHEVAAENQGRHSENECHFQNDMFHT